MAEDIDLGGRHSMAIFFAFLTALLPWPLKRVIYRARGWRIASGAYVGLSVLNVHRLTLGPNARVGHGNLFVRVKYLELQRNAAIGSLNRFVGPSTIALADRVNTRDWPSSLIIGEGAIMFSANYFDVSGGVRIGSDALLAGGFSKVWSHGPVDRDDGHRGLAPRAVTVGRHTYVGAGSVLLPGCLLPDRCTLGAASVLTPSAASSPEGSVLAGNPAAAIPSKSPPVRCAETDTSPSAP